MENIQLLDQNGRKLEMLSMSKQNIIGLLFGCLFLFLLQGCAVAKNFGPYMGKVIDSETEKPIEGAIVFMKITTVTPNVGGGQFHFADAKEVLTDSNGEFYIELRGVSLKPTHFWWPDPQFSIFKPSYGSFPFYPGSNVDILERDTSHIFPKNTFVTIRLPKLRTREERRRNLAKAHDYGNRDIPYEKRQMYFKMTNEESVAVGLKPLPFPNK